MSQALTLSIQNKADQNVEFGSWYQGSALRRLINRSDLFEFKPHAQFERTAFLFHQPQALPLATTQAAVDLEDFDAQAFWLTADLVQMMPDRDTLVMIPSSHLSISEHEQTALLHTFNQHFRADGVQLKVGGSGRWYLSLPQVIDIKTVPLDQACFRNMHGLYPCGHASAYWRSLINEVQMLFFSHPVNERRRAQGLAEINSIWLWGEGRLQQNMVLARPASALFSNRLYARGLAHLTNAQYHTTPLNYQAWWLAAQNIEHSLVELELEQQDDQSWQSLNQAWLEPILQALQDKVLHSVLLDFSNTQGYLIEPKHLKRFWRWKDRFNLRG